MKLQRVRPTVRFIAVSEDTSRLWAAAIVAGLTGIPWGIGLGLLVASAR